MHLAEIALVAGAIAFYLHDALLLLYSDEVVFVRGRRGWRAVFGSDAMLGGRYPAWPALFAPGAPVLRARWDAVPQPSTASSSLMSRLRRVAPLRWPARLMAVLLFVALPVALVLQASTHVMLALLIAVYATSTGAVAYLVYQRRHLDLTPAALASIGLEVIACPPFAVNVVRRLTLRMPLDVPADAFACAMLGVEAREAAFAQAHRRLQLAGIDHAFATPDGASRPIPNEGTR